MSTLFQPLGTLPPDEPKMVPAFAAERGVLVNTKKCWKRRANRKREVKSIAYGLIATLAIVLMETATAAEKPKPAMDGTSADMWGKHEGAKANLVHGEWLKDSRFAMFIHWGLYSEWRVRCGDANVTFPLIDTGERPKRAAFGGVLPRFRTYRIGMFNFPKPGGQRLTISPTGTVGKGVRVSSVSLTPVE
jgi:hypothetical protein